jgi:hypothetical protein
MTKSDHRTVSPKGEKIYEDLWEFSPRTKEGNFWVKYWKGSPRWIKLWSMSCAVYPIPYLNTHDFYNSRKDCKHLIYPAEYTTNRRYITEFNQC